LMLRRTGTAPLRISVSARAGCRPVPVNPCLPYRPSPRDFPEYLECPDCRCLPSLPGCPVFPGRRHLPLRPGYPELPVCPEYPVLLAHRLLHPRPEYPEYPESRPFHLFRVFPADRVDPPRRPVRVLPCCRYLPLSPECPGFHHHPYLLSPPQFRVNPVFPVPPGCPAVRLFRGRPGFPVLRGRRVHLCRLWVREVPAFLRLLLPAVGNSC